MVRNAIQDKDYTELYVKRTVPKSDSVRSLIYEAIRPNVLFETCSPSELDEVLDIFEPCTFEMGQDVIKQGENGDTFYVVEAGELSITVAVVGEGGGGKEDDVVNMVVVRDCHVCWKSDDVVGFIDNLSLL